MLKFRKKGKGAETRKRQMELELEHEPTAKMFRNKSWPVNRPRTEKAKLHQVKTTKTKVTQKQAKVQEARNQKQLINRTIFCEEVITKAVGAVLGGFQESVLTFDQFTEKKKKNKNFRAFKVDLVAFHHLSCVNGIVGDGEPTSSAEDMQLFLKTWTGKTITIKCNSTTTTDQLKRKIQDVEGIEVKDQQLISDGRQLEDGKTLGDYKIANKSTLHLVILDGGGSAVPLYIPNELRCPDFDFDFTEVVDNKLYKRGRFTYKRPCGWNRIALNVIDKFEDNVWIGSHRERTTGTSSLNEEWPVSYHGTGKHRSQSIAANGYLLSKGKRFLHGRGIYSAPDIDIAELYASKFTHGTNEFLAVMQNRVNPKSLIRIAPSTTGVGEYWVTPTQEDIRPYGICIKQVN